VVGPRRLYQCLEDRPFRFDPVSGRVEIILDCNHGISVQGDSPKLLTLSNNIDHGLVPISLEIADLEATEFGFS